MFLHPKNHTEENAYCDLAEYFTLLSDLSEDSIIPRRMAKDELAYIVGPTAIKLTIVMCVLAFFVHMFACFYWRVKVKAPSITANALLLSHLMVWPSWS
jgi:hypothetical protein